MKRIDDTRKARRATLASIARRLLGFETLESRGSDSLDFREVGVERVAEALEAAYQAGFRAAREGAAK
jgi:hypothetical protein